MIQSVPDPVNQELRTRLNQDYNAHVVQLGHKTAHIEVLKEQIKEHLQKSILILHEIAALDQAGQNPQRPQGQN